MSEQLTGPVPAFHSGMQMLGYRFIPAGAFDAAGNLAMPADFKLPSDWSETVGRVTSSPDWGDLLNILGVLATPGTDWSCWRVAVSFREGILRVMVVRSGALGEAGSQVALNWANNAWPRIGSLRDYAGRKRLLPAGLTDGVKEVANQVKDSPYWDKAVPDAGKPAFDLLKWRVSTGLDLLAHVAEFVSSITTKSKVLATVLWFDPKHGSVPAPQLRWAPLHQLYSRWGLRAVHYWWNSGWAGTAPPTYPFVYSSTLQRKGWGVTDVAHEPSELAAAIYPNANWTPPKPPPPPPRQRVCEEDENGKMRCRWERAEGLLAESDGAEASDGVEFASPFDPPDLAALEGAGANGLLVPPSEEPALEADGGEAAEESPPAPLVLAYGQGPDGYELLGGGTIRDGVWYPREEDEAAMPESVVLPSLGVVARADGSCLGWRPAGQLPSADAVLER